MLENKPGERYIKYYLLPFSESMNDPHFFLLYTIF